MSVDGCVVIFIRRYVRPDREREFLDAYHFGRADHPAFVRETLTKLSEDQSDALPPPAAFKLRDGCLNYLNIAVWRDLEAFKAQCSMGPGYFDAKFEVAPRERRVMRIESEFVGPGAS